MTASLHDIEIERERSVFAPRANPPAPTRVRWHCRTCGVRGNWTTPVKAAQGGEVHVALRTPT